MVRISIYNDIYGKKLECLMSYIKDICDRISIVSYYNGNLTSGEFTLMQSAYEKSIFEDDQSRRISYYQNTDGYFDQINRIYKTKDKAIDYFDRLLEQEMEVLNMIDENEYRDKITPQNNSDRKTDYIEARYTRMTPVTRGPVFQMLFYDVCTIFSELVSDMDSLFKLNNSLDEYAFEDLMFYDGDRVVLAICSHEKFAHFNLNNTEYEELKKLEILIDEDKD